MRTIVDVVDGYEIFREDCERVKLLAQPDQLYKCKKCFIYTPKSAKYCVGCGAETPDKQRKP